MIEPPAVGRKVWYYPYDAEKKHERSMHGMGVYGNQPLDATVIAVHGSRCVNLFVIDVEGKTFPCTSRTLLQDGDAVPPQGGYAVWMPYQVGQAKKHEADKA